MEINSMQALAAFGSQVLDDLLQGEWEPNPDWQQNMIELATKHRLMTTRPSGQEDDPEEYDFIYFRIAPEVSFPAATPPPHP
jgi:hypothetical protein